MPVNYDEAVGFYDATRGYREGVVERYRDALFAVTGADESARILELGIGSGLIARAFQQAAQYVGIDYSLGMMRLVAGKLTVGEGPLLARADARNLPFRDRRFDIVHAVRVFHHLQDWRDCIDEARRVLRRGGALVIVENIAPAGSDRPPWAIVQDKWDEILSGLGVDEAGADQGIWLTDEAMRQYIESTGALVEAVDLLRYREKPVSARIMVERRAARMFSSDWRLPEAIPRRSARELSDWLENDCAAPDELIEREMLFRAVIARWQASGERGLR